jgi:hypothetical protein
MTQPGIWIMFETKQIIVWLRQGEQFFNHALSLLPKLIMFAG